MQALVAAQGQTREQLTEQAIAIATASVRDFNGWYDSGQITEWSAKLSTVIEAILRALARNTDAYMARAVSDVAGKRIRPAGIIDVTSLRNAVTHAGAYARAADVYRYQQSLMDSFARSLTTASPPPAPPELVSPIDAAVERIRAVTDADTQLAVRAQAQQTMKAASKLGVITGWRRVIHPELSKGGTCGLCVAASDRIYHVEELMPIHDKCKCVPLPIRDSKDPGSMLNKQDLEKLYEHAGSTAAEDLKRTRYIVNEHGELGPVLTDGTFRSPAKASKSKSGPAKSPEQARAAVDRAYQSMLPALDKANQLAAADPNKWGKYAGTVQARVDDLAKQLAA